MVSSIVFSTLLSASLLSKMRTCRTCMPYLDNSRLQKEELNKSVVYFIFATQNVGKSDDMSQLIVRNLFLP